MVLFKCYQLVFWMLLIKGIDSKKQRKDGHFTDKNGIPFRGTCDNHHEKACQWNRHCPGKCDDNSSNAGEFCKNPIDCPQGSCIHNQCVKPNGVCANDSGVSCNKNKDCKPYECMILRGFCDNDSSVTCKGKIDCPNICTEGSENADTLCSRHRHCGFGGKCGRGNCVVLPETATPSGTPSSSIAPWVTPTTGPPSPQSPPCPPPGLENVVETYEECLCFYALATSGLKLGDESTYDNVFDDDSIQNFAQTGTYYGVDGIKEYLSYAADGEFVLGYTEVRFPLFLNMTFSATTGQCIATSASRRRLPYNPVYIKDNQDMCVDAVAGSTLYYTMTGDVRKPINIHLFNTWLPDEIISNTISFQNTPATAEYVCNIITNACNYTSGVESMESSNSCLDMYNSLPLFDTVKGEEESLSYLDGNSKGCRILHSYFSLTNKDHCPHVSFEADKDINGFVKCNKTKGALTTDLFTEKEISSFYSAAHMLGLDSAIDIRMESCTPKAT